MTPQQTTRAAFVLTSADIPQAIAWIADHATELGANERQSFRAQLSAEELIVNALDHGGRDRLSVCVTLGALPDRLRLTVEDDGGPFDLSKAEERKADAAVEAALPGGWGLQLVRRFAAEVRYERTEGRNVVVLDFTP